MTVPEERARRLLDEVPAYVWDGAGLPVPVEEIAESCAGLLICEAPDLRDVPGAPPLEPGDALSGLLVVDEKRIWVDAAEAEQSPGRRRFTIGHELGHWYLHAREGAGERIFCRAHALHDGTAGEPAAGPDIEEEASRFAATLLFPDALVRAEHDRLGGDVLALCERFGGSRVATERAVFRAVRLPYVRERAGSDVACFHYDDAGYDAWREAHRDDGFMVNDVLGEPDKSRLHRMRCSYLAVPARPGRPRTRHAKWCATDLGLLAALFADARRCTRCRP